MEPTPVSPTPVSPTPVSPTPAARADVPLAAFASFDFPWLAHGVSTRAGGVSTGPYASLNLGASVGDDEQAVLENRARLARTAGFTPERMVTTPQVHGCDVLVVDEETAPTALSVRADILVTRERGFLLMQRFADCVPILLADTRGRAISVAHAGWRGTALGVAARAVEAASALGAEPSDLRAGIGPSIGPCCFEVGEDVVAAFPDAGEARTTGPNGRAHLDLWEINRRQLVAAGVPADQIEVLGACTRCDPGTFFSHRALGYPAGRFGAVIGMRADG